MMCNLGGRGCTCRVTMCELYTVDQCNEGSDGVKIMWTFYKHGAFEHARASVASYSITSERERGKAKEIFNAKNAFWIRRRCRYCKHDAHHQE